VPDVSEGDEAVLIGSQGAASLPAEDVAETAGTIAYELLCGIGPRVPRRYLNGEDAGAR
jgi:alanine racemase